MNRNSTINKVIAVILAILLWAYVVIVVNPPSTATVRGVPVQLLNADKLERAKLAIAGDGIYTVDVLLSGTRLDVTGVEEGSVTATADLGELTAGQNYITVKVSAPKSTTIEEIRTERIQVYVDELVSVEKDVRLNVTNIPEDMELGALMLSNKTVAVSGAKILVDSVKYLNADLDASELNADRVKTLNLSVAPVNADGRLVKGVSVATEKIKLTAALYNVSFVPLYTRVEGMPGLGASIESTSIPSDVYIKAPLEELSRIAQIETEVINIEGVIENCDLELKLILPKGVELSERNPPLVASFVISDSGTLSFMYSADSIQKLNLDPTLVATAIEVDSEAIRADVSATVEILEVMAASDIVLEIDMSELMEPGVYELAISGRSLSHEGIAVAVEPAVAHVIVEHSGITAEEPGPDSQGSGGQN